MNSIKPSDDHEIFKRIHNDMIDSFDEELEMEVEDGMLPEWQVPKTQAEKDAAKLERRQYFQELFRMQGGFSLCRQFCRHQGVAARARIL